MTHDEILAIFFVECEEALAALEAGLAACQDGSHDPDTINRMMRGVHSIKGGAGAFGMCPLQAFTHCFESLLSDLRDGDVPVTDRLVALMLDALDTLSDHIDAARIDAAPPDDVALSAGLNAARATAGKADRERGNSDGGDCDDGDCDDGDDNPGNGIGDDLEALLDAVAARSAAAAGATEAEPPAPATVVLPPVDRGAAPGTTAAGASIRIDLHKLERLIDAVGEMVIAQSMLAQRWVGKRREAGEELALLEGLTRDIQEHAMAIRAQPIGAVFSRVPRIVRELSAVTGKLVKLEVSGEETQLDRTVIDRLGEPLTHLIRNAVDHGIEDGDERVARGKSAQGTIRLSAQQRAGRIVIRIADDGGGIDRQRVLAQAVAKGIVVADAALSNEEIDNLIFAPGFSTAPAVSNISGRGVGMDVVRQNVKDLDGRITIESAAGQGTTFTLTLPLTLAIADGMIVTVGDQTMVVPLVPIVECLAPAPGALHGLGTARLMLDLRGSFIPVVPVCQAMGTAPCPVSPQAGVLIIVDTEAAGRAALLVDTICDQRQVVIKSLNTHFRAVSGVAGATILGDGRVALILDIDGMVAGALAARSARQAA